MGLKTPTVLTHVVSGDRKRKKAKDGTTLLTPLPYLHTPVALWKFFFFFGVYTPSYGIGKCHEVNIRCTLHFM